MNQILIDAIKERQVICFYHDSKLREVEPHAYGLSIKGEPILRAFQVGGASKSGKIPCWRSFEVAKIQNIYMAGRQFAGPRPGFVRDDGDLSEIYAQL